eukprot:3952568-Prymnesium_polylepis.1
MSSRFLGSVETSQPRPVGWVNGGPIGAQPPSSSSMRMRSRFAAAICGSTSRPTSSCLARRSPLP